MGGRGGVDVPDGDRRGIYNHLAAHYGQFEKEPPPFKSLLSFQDHLEYAEGLMSGLDAFAAHARDRVDVLLKEGRVLSAASRDRLAALASAMRESLANIEKLLDETDPEKANAVMREYMRYQKIVAELVAV
jgi:hypothetical protein